MTTIDRSRIKMLTGREESRYVAERPKSRALFERAKTSLLGGVPMNWMMEWAGSFPIFINEGNGAYLTDVDGHRYLDLCMGDTGAMFGHSPRATVEAVMRQVQRGLTFFLPTEDAIWVAEELTRRFGLPYWQFYMTATDANRFAIRVAREVTGRNLVLVFDRCYHGNLDETLVSLKDGEVCHWMDRDREERVVGLLPNPASTTRVIQFNDLDALEKALSPQDIACVLCEPAMTNAGIIYPDTGYHEALREMTQRFGTLLVIDETHTICAGPGGLTQAWELKPDIVTLGKPIAGGLPAACMGLSREITEKLLVRDHLGEGIGGTLSGNALALATMKATLENIITEPTYRRTIHIAEQLADGIDKAIKAADLPWYLNRLGCRVEYGFCPTPPKNGAEARAAFDVELDNLLHLFLINRGILLTPFHSVELASPEITDEDVDFHNRVFSAFVNELVG